MATVAITPTTLVSETASATLPIASGTAIVAANTNTFAYPREGKLVLQLNNTYAGAKVFTIAAGTFCASGKGALEVSLAQDEVKFLVVDGDRHKNNSGLVSLTYESGTTGFVQALYVP